MKPVVITGAGGFVGSAIAEGLSRRGLSVVGMDAHFDATTHGRPGAASLIEGDQTPIEEALALTIPDMA